MKTTPYLFFALLVFFLFGCEKTNIPPTVETHSIKNITQTTAQARGYIVVEPHYSTKERGMCWDTLPNPSIAKNHYSNCPQRDTFLCPLFDLLPGRKYYCRAFARNEFGIDYGKELEFNTSPKQAIVDLRDGNEYLIVGIGEQTWMAEDLRFLPDTGVAIFNGNYFYTWETAYQVCPEGWHLPTDGEWKELEMFLGMHLNEVDSSGTCRGTNEGGKLKGLSTKYWGYPNKEATNETGFTAKGAGYYAVYLNKYYAYQHIAAYWTSTEYNNDLVYCRELINFKGQIFRLTYEKSNKLSVRCIQD